MPRLTSFFFVVLLVSACVIELGAEPPEEYQLQVVTDYEVRSLDSFGGPDEPTWWIRRGDFDPANLEAGSIDRDRPGTGWSPVAAPANLASVVSGSDRPEIWYRKALVLPRTSGRAWSLRLGIITDRDRVYFNGVRIGATGDWESAEPQAYDRVRIYDLPESLVRPGGLNLIHVHVRGYFPNELGIFQDRTTIGPTRQIWHRFYRENIYSTLILAFYLAVGGYFLFLFLRRRMEYENLYFGSFIVLMVVYQFLRTQFKFEFETDFLTLKKTEYLALQLLVPLFFQFIRSYFPIRGVILRRILRYGVPVLHVGVAVAFVSILFTDSAVTWDWINRNFSQPMWGLYVLASFAVVIRKIFRRNTDALIIGAGLVLMSAVMVVDVLTARGVFNLPALVPIAFILFILGFALILANRFVRLHNEADRLNIELEGQAEAFHRFVPGQFLELLGKKEVKEIGLGDSAFLKMSILFSDLRSFTSLSEDMRPEDNFKFLNSYLQRMEPGIQNHGGFVDKFVGDAIMALFPENPDGAESSADRAVAAAIDMRRILREYNVHRSNKDYAPIDFGIGINSGNLMLGTVGSAERLDTTVIGDSVNLASRIEGLTSVYQVGIILSEYARLDLTGDLSSLREIDTIIVKGRHEPIIIFEIFEADEDEVREIKAETRDRFEGAVALYKSREFVAAQGIFESLYRLNPNDRVVQLYIKRCRKLRETPPGPDWSGAARVRFK